MCTSCKTGKYWLDSGTCKANTEVTYCIDPAGYSSTADDCITCEDNYYKSALRTCTLYTRKANCEEMEGTRKLDACIRCADGVIDGTGSAYYLKSTDDC